MSSASDFVIENGVLKEYKGPGGDVAIPDGVTEIGRCAFFRCGSLRRLTIPNSVTSIGEFAFSGCERLTSVVLPDSVASIGTRAFSGSGLTSVVLPRGETSIGDEAFLGCGSLESVTIPDGVTHIGKRAFSRCPAATFSVANRPENFVIENGVLKKYKGPGGDVIIPDGVTSIKGEFPDGAFSDCECLTSVVIPNGVTSIGEFAFSGCERLTRVVIPDSVTTIERFAFSGCPAATFRISEAAANRAENFVIENGVLTEYHGPGGDVVIPAGVMRIGSSAFCGCECLTSVMIPESVISIEDSVFSGCIRLTSVVIPETVTELAETAFGTDEPELLEWEPCSYELTIRAPAGSAAERYAKKYGFSFAAE